MSPTIEQKTGAVALLSVAGLTDGQSTNNGDLALLEVGGRPLLVWQMLALRRAGVDVFLIEVDTVPGVLLDLADSFRISGVRVEFVRTAKDLQAFVTPTLKLVVQAEAHYFSNDVVEELTRQVTPYIATIDSRDENAAFERIDLNTRWAGFALLDASTALAMTGLPEGWSITSSLLRQAIQDGVKLRSIPQSKLQRGEVLRISNALDAAALGNGILAERAQKAPGWIEKHIFGAIAKQVAPSIWRLNRDTGFVGFVAPFLAVISLACGIFGLSVAAVGAALAAMLAQITADVVRGTDDGRQGGHWRHVPFWGMLVAAAIAVGWAERGYLADTPSFMAIVVALAFLARRMALRRWSASLLQSPALLAAGLLVPLLLSLFGSGLKAIVFAQLGLLLADRYLPASKDKNNNQA